MLTIEVPSSEIFSAFKCPAPYNRGVAACIPLSNAGVTSLDVSRKGNLLRLKPIYHPSRPVQVVAMIAMKSGTPHPAMLGEEADVFYIPEIDLSEDAILLVAVT